MIHSYLIVNVLIATQIKDNDAKSLTQEKFKSRGDKKKKIHHKKIVKNTKRTNESEKPSTEYRISDSGVHSNFLGINVDKRS